MVTDLQLEQVLLNKAKENKDAFKDIYTYLLDDVYRFSYTLVHDKQDAEDVTSQAFIALYQKLDAFEWRGISLKYWLFRTARNFAMRKLDQPQTTEFDEEKAYTQDYYEISFVDEIINKDLVEIVKKEILKLKPLEQETINLRIWEGMQFDEIAELQDEKVNTCKWRFYRSIEKLSKSLEQQQIRSLAPLPILFTTIKAVSTDAQYVPSAALKQSLLTEITNMNTPLSKPTGVFTNKVLLTSAVVGTIAVLSIGGFLGIKAYQNNKNKDDNKIVITATPTSTPTPTEIAVSPTATATAPQITATTAPTATPITSVSYSFSKEFINTTIEQGVTHKANYSFTMQYPSNYQVKELNCANQPTTNEKGCYHIRVQKDAKNYLELELDYLVSGMGGLGQAQKGTPIIKLANHRVIRQQLNGSNQPFTYLEFDTCISCTNTVVSETKNIGVSAGFGKDEFSNRLTLTLGNYKDAELIKSFESIARTIKLK